MEPSKDYIKGFNSGYIIRKNHPIIIKELEKGAKGNSPYLEGLKAGARQYVKELEMKLKAFKKELRMKKSGKDKGLEI